MSGANDLSELRAHLTQMIISMRFDLAMRPSGSTFSGAVFGKPDVTIKKNFDGAIEGFVMVKLTDVVNKKDANEASRWIVDNVPVFQEVFQGVGEKLSNLFSDSQKDKMLLKIVRDTKRQDLVLQRILEILSNHYRDFDTEHVELFSVDHRVSKIVAGYLARDDEGAKEAWTEMNDEEKRDVLAFMHELKEKKESANMAELSFLYDLQSLLF